MTFARDSNRFYATLATRGKTYLVEGDVGARRARVLRENVECPSLSPDDRRLVYKKLADGGDGSRWRYHSLDLETQAEVPLAETRSADDQGEWLDEGHILYSISPDVFMLSASGDGKPCTFLTEAYSPTVVR